MLQQFNRKDLRVEVNGWVSKIFGVLVLGISARECAEKSVGKETSNLLLTHGHTHACAFLQQRDWLKQEGVSLVTC